MLFFAVFFLLLFSSLFWLGKELNLLMFGKFWGYHCLKHCDMGGTLLKQLLDWQGLYMYFRLNPRADLVKCCKEFFDFGLLCMVLCTKRKKQHLFDLFIRFKCPAWCIYLCYWKLFDPWMHVRSALWWWKMNCLFPVCKSMFVPLGKLSPISVVVVISWRC